MQKKKTDKGKFKASDRFRVEKLIKMESAVPEVATWGWLLSISTESQFNSFKKHVCSLVQKIILDPMKCFPFYNNCIGVGFFLFMYLL